MAEGHLCSLTRFQSDVAVQLAVTYSITLTKERLAVAHDGYIIKKWHVKAAHTL